MEDSHSLFTQASQGFKQGNKTLAQDLLNKLVVSEPGNEQAWLLLSWVVDNPDEIEKCLHQMLAISPDNLAASKRLFKIVTEKEKKNSPSALVTTKTRNDNGAGIALLFVIYVAGILSARIAMLLFLILFAAIFLVKCAPLIKKVFVEKKEPLSGPSSGMEELIPILLLIFVQGIIYWQWAAIAPPLRSILMFFIEAKIKSRGPY